MGYYWDSSDIHNGYWDAFINIVGKNEEIEQLAEVMFGEKGKDLIKSQEDSEYSQIRRSFSNPDERLALSGWPEKLRKRISEFRNCEIFYTPHYNDNDGYNYFYKGLGSDNIEYSELISEFKPKLGKGHEIFGGYYDENKVKITLRDNSVIEFKRKSNNDLDFLSNLKTESLTIGKLANMFVDPKSKNKNMDYIKQLYNKVKDVTNIIEITVFTSRINKKFTKAALSKMQDINFSLFAKSQITRQELKKYNFETNTLTINKKHFVQAPKKVKDGEYALEKVKVLEKNTKPVSIIGYDKSNKGDFIFRDRDPNKYYRYPESVCLMCFSKTETIEIPKVNSFDEEKIVTEIDSLCFEGNKAVKKIIVPEYLEFIQPDAFKGCSNLKFIAYKGDEKSGDFAIKSNKRLASAFTSNESYEVPSDVTNIGKFAFASCLNLKTIYLHSDLKRLTNNSLAKCRPLTTVVLPINKNNINFMALKRANIKKLVIEDQISFNIYDESMFDYFLQNEQGVIDFDYNKAAKNIQKVKNDENKYNIAIDFLENHREKVNSHITKLAQAAIEYCISIEDTDKLKKIFSFDFDYKLDYQSLLNYANSAENEEIKEIIQENSNINTDHKEIVKVKKSDKQLYIQVKFSNKRSYKYFCDFDVAIGDTVFVEGKLAKMPGIVVDILENSPKGRAASYTLNVKSALREK